ncbi:MAG: phospholipid carrier-dependent glycosyltransferase [Chloroflexi bacterium]|nr:phospholipid carrier-dependent glycosyltransferase [Chloroflexota bacterium]
MFTSTLKPERNTQETRRDVLILIGILFISLAARIYGLTAPVVGIRGWRQADTMAIANNYFENGYNFFYPQIDWGGNSPGFVETEFPIYSFLAALLFGVVGKSELTARLLSIAFALVGIYMYHKLVGKLTDVQTAQWATLFIGILPLSVYMGRTIMPEPLLVLCIISGVYFFNEWLKKDYWTRYTLAVIFISTACLIKPQTLYMGLPLSYLAWQKFGNNTIRQWKLWFFAGFISAVLVAWYYHAHQTYLQNGLTFGIWEYGTDKWGNWDLVLTADYWHQILVEHLGQRVFAWIAYPIFILGLFLKRESPHERVFDFWLIGILIYFLIVGKGNYIHDYYQLPFIIPAGVYLGKVFSRYFHSTHGPIYLSLIFILPAIFISSAYAYYSIYFQGEDPRKSLDYELAQHVRSQTEKGSLIVAIDGGDPTLLYLSERKGWHGTFTEILDKEYLDQLISEGAKYVVGSYETCGDPVQCSALMNLFNEYEVVFDKKDYFIIKLTGK